MVKTIILSLLILALNFSFAPLTYAQGTITNPCPGPNCQPNPFGNSANTINIGQQLPNSGLGVPSPPGQSMIGTVLRNVITLFFAVGGIGALIYFVWGAVDWTLSGGDKEKVSNARKKMTHAIIGLIMLSLSFVIIQVVGEIVGFNPLQTIDIRSLGDR